MEPKSNYQRLPSTELCIREIVGSSYVQDEVSAVNYLLTVNKKRVMYINVVGNILRKEAVGSITNFWIDDGTGQIVVRFFEEHKKAKELDVGDIILVIGKPRVYNEEKYISPEIVSKVNPSWLKVRSLKLQKNNTIVSGDFPASPAVKVNESEIKEEIIGEKEDQKGVLPVEKMVKLIKELDKGIGAPIEEVLEQSPLVDAEQILKRMLESGEIFQNSPGKVKVL